MAAFSAAGAFDTGSSKEMLRDAIYLSLETISGNLPYDVSMARWSDGLGMATGSIPPLQQFKINWRDDADRIIIVFSDENDQTFLTPGLEPSDLMTAISAAIDTKLYVFTKPYYRSQWGRYINPTGGSAFILTSDAEQMYNDLMSILDEICLPDDSQSAATARPENSMFLPVSTSVRYDYVYGMCL
jgi:hypothetical protein